MDNLLVNVLLINADVEAICRAWKILVDEKDYKKSRHSIQILIDILNEVTSKFEEDEEFDSKLVINLIFYICDKIVKELKHYATDDNVFDNELWAKSFGEYKVHKREILEELYDKW